MDRNDLINRLLEVPARILVEEERLLKAQEETQKAQRELDRKEGELLRSDLIDGKNAEIRKAQLADLTIAERGAVRNAVEAEARARINLSHAQNEFAAYRSVSRLLAGEVA